MKITDIWKPTKKLATHASMLWDQIMICQELRIENERLKEELDEERKRFIKRTGVDSKGSQGDQTECPFCQFVDEGR
tara:strand:+ start:91 stop:321 length:231 start_codon:yes stop_codon:yes gene_type:complete